MLRWLTVRSWFRSLVLRRRADRDIEDELRFHIEEEVEAALRSGLTPEEAHRVARAGLGGSSALIRDACRDQTGVTLVDDLARDLKHGARLLRRNPGFTAVVLATLAIAIGATVTVFSIVNAWLFTPLRFPEPDRLVIAFAAQPDRPSEPAVWLPYRAYLAWKERSRTFTSVSGAFVRAVDVTTSTDAYSVLGLSVTQEFFKTMGVGPFLGRTLSTGDEADPHVVVLSHGFWKNRMGGSPAVVGSTISLSGVPHMVVGVMPADFETRVLDMRFEFWTPLRHDVDSYKPGGVGPVTIVGRLANGITIDAARAELASISRATEARYPLNFNSFVINVTSLQADNTRTVRATLWTVSAAVATLLMIAAMNVGALLLGRGLGRTREVAIRAAIGSSRAQLVRQFLTESLLIAVCGGLAGLAFAAVAIRLFVAWNPLGTLPANAIGLNMAALGAAGIAMGVTALVSGLVPAIRISTANPHDALSAGSARGHAAAPAQRAQGTMLVAQMAVSVVLLVATTLLVRTFARLQSAPLGFDASGLSIASVVLPTDPFGSSETRNIYYHQLAERVRAIPGVRAVAAGTSPPLTGGAPMTVNVGPEDAMNAPRISAQEITTEFFETLGVPVLAGRPFDQRDAAKGLHVVILNARAAHDLFGGATAAIGRRVRLNREPWREVVGVVGNVQSTFFNTLEWQTIPILYRPAAQAFSTIEDPSATRFRFQLHLRSDRRLTLAEVRDAVVSINSRAAVTEFRSVPDMIADATKQPSFRMTLLSSFAAISLLLSAMGVYGLVSQSVNQRLREVAIRLALGARTADVLFTVTYRALLVGVAGIAVGAFAAFMFSDSLKALLYGVQPHDVMSFTAAAGALLVVTTAAAFVPAFRAIRVDPVTILRAE
jgi:putative ABC transport system permease protein